MIMDDVLEYKLSQVKLLLLTKTFKIPCIANRSSWKSFAVVKLICRKHSRLHGSLALPRPYCTGYFTGIVSGLPIGQRKP